jgi:hypothetical protein
MHTVRGSTVGDPQVSVRSFLKSAIEVHVFSVQRVARDVAGPNPNSSNPLRAVAYTRRGWESALCDLGSAGSDAARCIWIYRQALKARHQPAVRRGRRFRARAGSGVAGQPARAYRQGRKVRLAPCGVAAHSQHALGTNEGSNSLTQHRSSHGAAASDPR